MGWMRNFSIGKKLGLGFGLVLTLTVILAIISLIEVSNLNSRANDLGRVWLPGVTAVGNVATDTSVFRRDELNYLMSTDDKERAANQDRLDKAKAAVDETIKKYVPTIYSDQERQLYTHWQDQWDKYMDLHNQVVQLAQNNKVPEASSLLRTTGLQEFSDFTDGLEDDINLNNKGAAMTVAQADSTYTSARYWILGLSAGAIIVGFFVALALARAIGRSTGQMLAAIEEVAANNLSIADMEITSEDEIGKAGIALNKMKNNLRAIIESISGTAQQVASASTELSATSQQITANSQETSAQAGVVSTATQQVSQNLQTVATGAEEMGASIKEIAKNATEAAKVSTSAVQVAESTNATVAKLGESSAEIGQVIKVITSIAQQTNLCTRPHD